MKPYGNHDFIRQTFHGTFVLVVLAVCVSMVAAGCSQHATAVAEHPVTFTKNVAPILYNHCAVCHRPSGIAPMPLLTYEQAQTFASLVRDRVVKGIMPPWFADSPHAEFANDPRLTSEEIHTITAWVDSGAPQGDPRDLPPQPEFSGGWQGGPPDAMFSMATPYTIPGRGEGMYVDFTIPTHFKEDKWIQTVEVLPGNSKVVHHSSLGLEVPAPDATAVQDGKIYDKYEYKVGMLHFIRSSAPVINDGCSSPWGGQFPDFKTIEEDRSSGGDIGVFLPGRGTERHLPGYAIRIPANSNFTLQMHYMPDGRVDTDQTRIGVWFAKAPVKAQVKRVEIWNMLFKIPAGDPNVRATSCYTFPQSVKILSYTAHMHYRGKDMTLQATYPDGRTETLISIPHYTFNWQLQYVLKDPKPIPKGTVIKTVAHFDNSAKNPLNPDPTKTIRWGEPSDSEMMGTWIEYTDDPALTPSPQGDLEVAARPKATLNN
jgi:hypothetical protein